MITKHRFPHQARLLLFVAICLLIAGALPPGQALAAVTRRSVNNAIEDFAATGSLFQRSALGTLKVPGSTPKLPEGDLPGAVQIGPLGILKAWSPPSAYGLPKRIYSMGAAAIGNRIYVIGGKTAESGTTAEVWSAAVSLDDGSILDPGWRAEPSLPAVVGSNNSSLGAAIAAINSPAVTAVANSGGGGYIYVLGGNVVQGGIDFSSYAVRVATVAADGTITAWRSGAAIPSPNPTDPFLQLGIQSGAALNFKTSSGTYVYLVGGVKRYYEGTVGQANLRSAGSKTVYYAKVGGDGLLYKPSSPSTPGWDTTNEIPLVTSSPETDGVWDAAAAADRFVVSTNTGSDTRDMLYLIGGQTIPGTSPTYSNTAFRATINADGTLTWSPGGQGNIEATLPTPRFGFGAVTFRGTIYGAGGQPGTGNSGQPDRTVLTSYVQDDMTLPLIGEGGSNFLKNDGTLPQPRFLHGTVLVPAGPNSPNAAFMYVLGGRGDTTDGTLGDDQGSNDVIFGKIGGSEDVKTTGYAPDGWYYSRPYPINFLSAEVQEVNWTTAITQTGLDIQLWYRVDSSVDCSNLNAGSIPWSPLDDLNTPTGSVNGENGVSGLQVSARCFQYRAKLISQDKFSTPSLLNLSIKIFIPGSPDLQVQTLADRRSSDGSNALTGLTVVILNHNESAPPTLGADIEEGGSFFVDLFVFGPGETVSIPSLPMTGNPSSDACASINKSLLGPDATFTISRWYKLSDPTCKDPAQELDILTLFPTPGTYTIVVAVDSYSSNLTNYPNGFVNETSTGGEDNNTKQITFGVTSVKHENKIYLPVLRRA